VDYVEISVHNFLVRYNIFLLIINFNKKYYSNRFVANRWLNQSKNDQKLEMELFGSEQPGLNKR
jgi:hypothetical protein